MTSLDEVVSELYRALPTSDAPALRNVFFRAVGLDEWLVGLPEFFRTRTERETERIASGAAPWRTSGVATS